MGVRMVYLYRAGRKKFVVFPVHARNVGRVALSLALAGSLISCSGPSAGEVEIVEEPAKHLPQGILSGSTMKVRYVDSALSPADQLALLLTKWYKESGRSGIGPVFTHLDGKHGDTVNRISFPKEFFRGISVEWRNTKGGSGLDIFYADSSIQSFELYEENNDGWSASSLKSELSRDLGQDLRLVPSSGIRRTVEATIELSVEGRAEKSKAQVSFTECDTSGANDTRNYIQKSWTDLDAPIGNRLEGKVCRYSVTYETPQVMYGARGEKSLHSASLNTLKALYIDKFGEPDCWVLTDGCLPAEAKDEIAEELSEQQEAL